MATRILIVDDDVAFVESNRDLLEAYGYEVSVAHDGVDGVKLAREVRPDVIILDVMMTSETEGLDVARRVHAIPELGRTGIILVTGVAKALHLPRKLEPDEEWLPVDRVLDKPIPPERLLKEIERILRNLGKSIPGESPPRP